VKVTQIVEFGTPEIAIVKTARTQAVDLIIMATRGKSGLSRIVLGSVTEEVIRNAPCPVLAITPGFYCAAAIASQMPGIAKGEHEALQLKKQDDSSAPARRRYARD
jgi:hypothetical protein